MRVGFLCVVPLAATLCASSAARAVVGASNEHGALEAHVVMVLTSAKRASTFCSGVVISREVVLTAAHCVSGVANTVVHFRDGSGRPVTLPIASIVPHPEYRANAIAKRERSIDMALIRLAQPLPDRFTPAPLDARATSVGDRFRVAGFGLSREGSGASGGVFRWGMLGARAPLSSILLWAEDPDHKGLGACTGDSGGPIFAESSDAIVAITAWTTGGGKGHCGGLTQGALVAPQRGWIDQTLSAWPSR
jgi:hypothetical protein